MFGLVKKELLQSAEMEISRLSQNASELERLKNKLEESLRLAQGELAQIRMSDLYRSAKTLEALRLEITSATKEKLEIESHLNEIKRNRLVNIEREVCEEKETIKERQKAEIENELSELIEKKNRMALEFSDGQSTLDTLNEKIAISKKELDEIVDGVFIAEALNTVNNDYGTIGGKNSQEIKNNIDELRVKQKSKITDKTAWVAYANYTLNGSLSEGKAQQKRLANFLLLTFNAYVDNVISTSKRGNFQALHKKIEQWFEKINKIGSDHNISIDRAYLMLRLQELKENCRYHIQLEMEKDEERYINELIKEETIAQKEIEAFVKRKEKEEAEYLKEVAKLSEKIKADKNGDTARLELLVSELYQKIAILQQEKQRAMSMAQLTRSGHVYIISNKGSFGPDIYKIGMTRRLDPMDRVRELGDASVPFFFDVHGIIHTEDAPSLERELHKAFDDRRVNRNNYRREFFNAKIEEIEEVISRIHGRITLDRHP